MSVMKVSLRGIESVPQLPKSEVQHTSGSNETQPLREARKHSKVDASSNNAFTAGREL
jgi:hypothetical protein